MRNPGQPSLFDLLPTREAVANPAVAERGKAPKEQHFALAGKRLAVLDALRSGPKTNIDLTGPHCGGQRFGARIDELRRMGFAIERETVDSTRGIYQYTLKSAPQ